MSFTAKDVKELIVQLSFLYQLDVVKIQDIIPICLTEKGTINKEELRNMVRGLVGEAGTR